LLDRFAGLLATKDGVTVAREVQLSDPVEALGAKIAADACLKVNAEVGDGTTSTSCIAASLLREGHRLVTGGLDPHEIADGMQAGADLALRWISDLRTSARRQKTLTRIASVATNGDEEVARVLSEATMIVGEEGVILVDEGARVGVHLLLREGMEIDTCLPYRSGLEEAVETLEGPLVAILNRHLRTVEDVRALVEVATQFPPYALLVMALSISGDALTVLTTNKAHLKDKFNLAFLETPGMSKWKSDELRDIAAAAGATFVEADAGHAHEKWDADWYGSFRRVEIKRDKTVFTTYPDHAQHVDQRCTELSLERDRTDSDYDKDQYDKRIARLSEAMAVVEVSAFTKAELRERRGRIEDALASLRAAVKGGVVPGGGVAYLEGTRVCEIAADRFLSDGQAAFGAGVRAVAKALTAPFLTLAANAGQDAPGLLYRVQYAREQDPSGWVGWDTQNIRDLGESPLIADPYLVVQEVVRSAVSVASTMLTIEVGIHRR
jgi:chaperonin GroEL